MAFKVFRFRGSSWFQSLRVLSGFSFKYYSRVGFLTSVYMYKIDVIIKD